MKNDATLWARRMATMGKCTLADLAAIGGPNRQVIFVCYASSYL